jgi:rod shape-determining protein MreC
VRQRDIDIVQQAIVRPQVDFSSLELVAVVTNFDPSEEIPELLLNEPSLGDIGGAEPLTTTLTTSSTLSGGNTGAVENTP